MASLSTASRTLLRTIPRSSTAALPVRAISTSTSKSRASATDAPSSSFESPFRGMGGDRSSKIPDFSNYRSKAGTSNNLVFQYFMVGTMGALTAAGAKATVQDFLVNMSASADVLAMAKVEVDLSTIPEGKNVIVKWRGKPVFIRHRTADEIKEAENVKVESLRDPQQDADRVKKPEWLVMVGVCTHLGCVPIGEAGDFGGWFCPCHGSHYDISGRIRRGPAPLNLEIPEYDFPEDESLVIG
ncbi:cytochrome b-c1 complex subunit Rieske [Phlyctema vagabunda]|uniref:Cytochrome b-c1 complex subunit Rieske, mitochondrial n=1 Tax=Phlyctema vagabunda TaxID=108571 RepID=A0ABR4PW32_9HELO